MDRYPLAVIRDRTDKRLDAWWTVLLVDPPAARLVRLAAPYSRITPNRLGALATGLGLTAALCFSAGGRGWLILGALLFHLGFVADCVQAKLARLRGAGSLLGGWYDFMVDRLRAVACAAALMGGQYARTGQARYLWLAAWVIGLDLLRYLNASQMAGVRAALRRQDAYATTPVTTVGAGGLGARLRAARIRTHLVSGIEFKMFVFVVAPLTGWITGTVLTAGLLLIAFEAKLVTALCRETRRHTVRLTLQPVHTGTVSAAPHPHLFDHDSVLAR